MNKISDKYSDKKLYSLIKYNNGLPVSAEDLHQYEDIMYIKNKLAYSKMLSNGIIETPVLLTESKTSGSTTYNMITINPIPLNIEGDIVYISNVDANNKGYKVTSTGDLYIFGWYEEINSASTITEYGGMYNNTMTNDIVDDYTHIQTTTKYQFRWSSAVVSVGTSMNVVVPKQGRSTSTTKKSVTVSTLDGDSGYYIMRDASTKLDTSLPFVKDDTMYLIKLASVVATSSGITSVTPVDPPDSRMIAITDREIDTIFES